MYIIDYSWKYSFALGCILSKIAGLLFCGPHFLVPLFRELIIYALLSCEALNTAYRFL